MDHPIAGLISTKLKFVLYLFFYNIFIEISISYRVRNDNAVFAALRYLGFLGAPALAQSHARAAAVLVDEFDAGLF